MSSRGSPCTESSRSLCSMFTDFLKVSSSCDWVSLTLEPVNQQSFSGQTLLQRCGSVGSERFGRGSILDRKSIKKSLGREPEIHFGELDSNSGSGSNPHFILGFHCESKRQEVWLCSVLQAQRRSEPSAPCPQCLHHLRQHLLTAQQHQVALTAVKMLHRAELSLQL